MSTSTLPSNLECVVTDGLPASWVTPPPVENRLMRRGAASLEKLDDIIPENAFLVVRVLRIDNPPRALEIELHSVFPESGGHRIVGKLASEKEVADFEGYCPELISIAAELVDRWPRYARPQSVALLTDGKILAFNPGRPEGRGYAWLHDHLSGESPCAHILGENEKPFAISRMAMTGPKGKKEKK